MKRKSIIALLSCLVILGTVHGQTIADEARLKTLPVLFQQTAAEYRALCYQAFNTARWQLEKIPVSQVRKKKMAIITDLDETILDNSYSDAQLVKEGKTYAPDVWKRWTEKAAATAVPGAVDFLQWASKRGFTILYISNRDTTELASTLQNLQTLQLPDAKLSNMLFLTTTSSKEARRQQVMKQYDIVMLMGDNLNDFTAAFEKGSIPARFQATDDARAYWGKKFIVLPNASYGEWESALYEYKRNLTPAQKDSMRWQLMKGY
jgi:5'-nucleotidase (lipoprotein e(P4) family)